MSFKFNPITGLLDLVNETTQNFSYKKIVTGQTVTIPENQQMLYVGTIEIDGTLIINGDAIEV